MTTTTLAAALTDCAAGLYPLEAGVALLVNEGTFLHRDDFTTRFIEHGTSSGTPMAAIDWDAAITALNAGELPCSAGSAASSPPQPASPPAPPLTSATPPPALTPATSTGSSPPSAMPPEHGRNTKGKQDQ